MCEGYTIDVANANVVYSFITVHRACMRILWNISGTHKHSLVQYKERALNWGVCGSVYANEQVRKQAIERASRAWAAQGKRVTLL